jgi:hypothetical protein
MVAVGPPRDPNEDELKRIKQDAHRRLTSLVDEAARLDDVGARARLEARLADALWDVNRPQAQELFQTAYRDSANVAESSDPTGTISPDCGAIRIEIIQTVLSRDAEFAYSLLSGPDNYAGCDFAPGYPSGFGENGRSVLLILVANGLANKSPGLAARLGEDSLEGGIVFNFPDLLNQIGTVDPRSAYRLTCEAIDRIATSDISPLEIGNLKRYVLAESSPPESGGPTGAPATSAGEDMIVRFLLSALGASDRFASRLEAENRAGSHFADRNDNPINRDASPGPTDHDIAAGFFSAMTDLLPAFEQYDREHWEEARAAVERLKRWLDPFAHRYALRSQPGLEDIHPLPWVGFWHRLGPFDVGRT